MFIIKRAQKIILNPILIDFLFEKYNSILTKLF